MSLVVVRNGVRSISGLGWKMVIKGLAMPGNKPFGLSMSDQFTANYN